MCERCGRYGSGAVRLPLRLRFRVPVCRRLAVWFWLGSIAWAPAAGAGPLPGADDKWQHLRSPNFELYSRNGTAAGRELLRNLELLHAVFIDRFKLLERRKQPVTVYSFASSKVFRAYAPAAWGEKHTFRGFYLDGVDRASIVLGPTEDWDVARLLIFHEYVHHLFRVSEEQPPVWFNEGVAELFSNLVVNRKTIEFGRPNQARVHELRQRALMPLEQLFAIDYESSVYRGGNHTGLFYAQAWALLHYWHFGDSKLPQEKVSQFLREARRQPPVAPPELRQRFNEAFGMDYPMMLRRLQDYVTHGKYRWSEQALPAIPPPESYTVTNVRADEMMTRLAALALWVNRSADGRLVLLQAAHAPAPDVRALEVLGADHLRDGDPATAKDYWQKAIAAGSANPAIFRELGLMESRIWFQHFDYYFRQPEPTTVQLRELLTRSLEYCPEQSAGYEMLAWVEAYAAKPSAANINLVQERFGRLREQPRTLLALALIRHRVGDDSTAIKLLDQLQRSEPDPWVAGGAAVIRSKITGEPLERPARLRRTAPPPTMRPPKIRPPNIDTGRGS